MILPVTTVYPVSSHTLLTWSDVGRVVVVDTTAAAVHITMPNGDSPSYLGAVFHFFIRTGANGLYLFPASGEFIMSRFNIMDRTAGTYGITSSGIATSITLVRGKSAVSNKFWLTMEDSNWSANAATAPLI